LTKLLIDGDLFSEYKTYWVDAQGYARISIGNQEEQHLHRYVMEQHLGRKLIPPECVHHTNENKLDNRLANLELCKDQAAHAALHIRQHAAKYKANLETHAWCTYHQAYEPKEMFSTSPQHWNGLHNQCRSATNKYRKEHGLNTDKFDWRARLNQQYRRAFRKNTGISCVSKEGSRL